MQLPFTHSPPEVCAPRSPRCRAACRLRRADPGAAPHARAPARAWQIAAQCVAAVLLGAWGVLGLQGAFVPIRTTTHLAKQCAAARAQSARPALPSPRQCARDTPPCGCGGHRLITHVPAAGPSTRSTRGPISATLARARCATELPPDWPGFGRDASLASGVVRAGGGRAPGRGTTSSRLDPGAASVLLRHGGRCPVTARPPRVRACRAAHLRRKVAGKGAIGGPLRPTEKLPEGLVQ